MEEQHVQAAQRWEYKRECLKHERSQLLELTMQAFCKVVYIGTERQPNHTSLLHQDKQAEKQAKVESP
jgi:hypothetical protein